MKKKYVSPQMKTMRLPEDSLMDVSVTDSEIGGGFVEGAKEMHLDDFDGDGELYTNKSVWED